MDRLIHVIYASTATHPLNDAELSELLRKAREKNHILDITGMLLHTAGNFFQVLEGPEDIVTTLYEEIRQDKRHKDATQIINEPIPQRSFTEWSMGFLEATYEQLGTIEGLNDFFQQGQVFTQLKNGRAKKLMTAFKQGRWHKLVNP